MKKFFLTVCFVLACTDTVQIRNGYVDMRAYSRQRGYTAATRQTKRATGTVPSVKQRQQPAVNADRTKQNVGKSKNSAADNTGKEKISEDDSKNLEIRDYIKNNPQVLPDV